MFNWDDMAWCEHCDEKTKKLSGFWDGFDPKTGHDVSGGIFICENRDCAICEERLRITAEDVVLKERVKTANFQNGTDAELLESARMKVRLPLGAAADIIGASAAEYSAMERGRVPIEPGEYALLMNLFKSIRDKSEGQPCGKCRYYRASGAYGTSGSCYFKNGAVQVGARSKACFRFRPRLDNAMKPVGESSKIVLNSMKSCNECGHSFNDIRECRFSSPQCMMIHDMISEYCSHCENEVTMIWDVAKLGYQAFCPICGNRLMLCGECLDNDGNGVCDYSGDTDCCYRQKEGVKNENKNE